MSKYYLTEAYGELYNPRKADETFYENLRFVDYLMQEEIEEVMESLLWEFMDYGNTLDESYGIIQNCFSDVILEEVLSEARMSPRQKAERAARVGSERAATLKQVAGEKATARRQERVAKVTGALKKAGQAVGKAATGVGSAVASATRAGKTAAAGAYDRAKGLPGKAMAALKGVVRKGAAAAIKAGRSTERAGKEAERTTVTTTTTSGGGRGAAPSTETTVEKSGGAKRRAIGGLLKKAGKAVASAIKGKSSGMSRGDYEERKAGRAAAARSAVGQPFSGGSSSGGSTPKPKPAGLGLKALQASGKKQAYNPDAANRSARRRMGDKPLSPSTPLTPWNKGPDKSGKASTSPLTIKAERRKQISLARQSQRNEEFELLAQYILEDFIAEGYANNYEDAFEILENLSEESILELTEMYLEG